MTKQEAIEVIKAEYDCLDDTTTTGCDLCRFDQICSEGGFNALMIDALKMAIEALKLQEICYCKDCEIRNKDGYCMKEMTFNLITMVEDTDFCSWGERGEK